MFVIDVSGFSIHLLYIAIHIAVKKISPMNRQHIIQTLSDQAFDIAVIGGGATGLGCAVDAASRGYRTVLIEKDDFGSGTSSKSTKLVHGGVRYLEQGNIFLVIEALQERGRLLRNAPHLVHDLPFVIPNYRAILGPYYWIGLKLYDLLSGKLSYGPSRWVSQKEVLAYLPNINPKGLRNGILYHDGQFDDARLLISLLGTFHKLGGVALNYAKVIDLNLDPAGKIESLTCREKESKTNFVVQAKVVVNATGVFTERIQTLDDPEVSVTVRPSQGSHLVLDKRFLGGEKAIMIPKTPDGRVLFAIPWQGRTLIGTTDAFTRKITNNPVASQDEIDFMLETAGRYLAEKPARKDILSVFAGIRPLVGSGNTTDTKSISRSHQVNVSTSGLVSITGGKWTTYRKMAEDTITASVAVANLPQVDCKTKELILDGGDSIPGSLPEYLKVYGSNAAIIRQMESEDPELAEKIHPELEYRLSQVVYACRHEMARRIMDVLGRRTRALFLHATAANEAAEKVARVMQQELGKDDIWREKEINRFRKIAASYIVKEDG